MTSAITTALTMSSHPCPGRIGSLVVLMRGGRGSVTGMLPISKRYGLAPPIISDLDEPRGTGPGIRPPRHPSDYLLCAGGHRAAAPAPGNHPQRAVDAARAPVWPVRTLPGHADHAGGDPGRPIHQI